MGGSFAWSIQRLPKTLLGLNTFPSTYILRAHGSLGGHFIWNPATSEQKYIPVSKLRCQLEVYIYICICVCGACTYPYIYIYILYRCVYMYILASKTNVLPSQAQLSSLDHWWENARQLNKIVLHGHGLAVIAVLKQILWGILMALARGDKGVIRPSTSNVYLFINIYVYSNHIHIQYAESRVPVCMHVCLSVCLSVCLYVCMYVCTYVRTYVCMYIVTVYKYSYTYYIY